MNFEWLEDFLALARELNFSRAAERRHITQPAFSRRIKALEDWFGVSLIDRSTQGARLTAAGANLVGHVENIVRDVHRAKAESIDYGRRAEFTLSLAATHALSFSFFPDWIREHAPHQTVNLMSDSLEACEQMMLRGDATFLLFHSHPVAATALKPRYFRTVKVGEDILVPLCRPSADGSPTWLLSAGDGPPWVPHLGYSSASGLGRILQAEWSQKGYRFNLTSAVTARLAAALLTLALDGRGVAWLPLSLAATDIAAGRLVDAGEGRYSTVVDISLARPSARLNAPSESFWRQFLS
jgi:DNA-binding transcriptional LysR family regulator